MLIGTKVILIFKTANIMAYLISEFESNKNAVLFHFPHLYPKGPAYEGQPPTGCVVDYLGYSISASVFWRGFRVFNNSENFSKPFPTLKEAKQFVIDRVNKKRCLW